MWMAASATGGIAAKVSITGSSSRSGRSTCKPSASPPMWKASTITKLRPRRPSGTSPSGGN